MPQECLILTMRQNQKYFPLFDAAGKLTGKFLIVSNMQVADPRHIVDGNQRVVRPRLEDARFFYDQDRKTRLEERVPLLGKVVYHNKLGSQLERVERVQLLAGKIARQLKADAALAERAAWLAKADLLTGMVGEFPELQGIMGRYYALHDEEPAAVRGCHRSALPPAFRGRHASRGSDRLRGRARRQAGRHRGPVSASASSRPATRILSACAAPRSAWCESSWRTGCTCRSTNWPRPLSSRSRVKRRVELMQFVYDRFAGYLKEQASRRYRSTRSSACIPPSCRSAAQLEAVKAFQALPEAESLAAANKRIVNILKQAEAKGGIVCRRCVERLTEPAERRSLTPFREQRLREIAVERATTPAT